MRRIRGSRKDGGTFPRKKTILEMIREIDERDARAAHEAEAKNEAEGKARTKPETKAVSKENAKSKKKKTEKKVVEVD